MLILNIYRNILLYALKKLFLSAIVYELLHITHQSWSSYNRKHYPYYSSYEETHRNCHIHQTQIDRKSVRSNYKCSYFENINKLCVYII